MPYLQAILTIPSNDLDTPNLEITLTGTGVLANDNIVYVCNDVDCDCNSNEPCSVTIEEAYLDSEDGAEIKLKAGFYVGDLTLEEPIRFTLSGGWNDDYSDNTGRQSTIGGVLTITGGTVTVEGIIIDGTDSLARTKGLQFGCWLPEYWSRWASLH